MPLAGHGPTVRLAMPLRDDDMVRETGWMPDGLVRSGPGSEVGRVMAAVAEMADGGLSERMRLDAAARVLVAARRMLDLAPREAATGTAAAAVLQVARGWDPALTTAAEQADALSPAALDAFLAAAPRWAASIRDLARDMPRAA